MSVFLAAAAAAGITAHRLTPPTTSYDNPLGKGDRRALMTVTTTHASAGTLTNIIDGSTGLPNWDWTGTSALFNITFDFGVAKVIDEATWYQSATGTHSSWIWEGSNDNSSYLQIGTSFVLGGALTQVHTVLNGNTVPYRYYRLRKTGVGTTAGGSDPREIEFKISA